MESKNLRECGAAGLDLRDGMIEVEIEDFKDEDRIMDHA
jgi:hypothetical protein